MTISTLNPQSGPQSIKPLSPLRGLLADGLTFTRAAVTPLIMILIMNGWPQTTFALLATALFALSAVTDILDDLIGGPAYAHPSYIQSPHRRLGWFDEIADTVLCIGTLSALSYVIYEAGFMSPFFAVPAGLIIIREALVGLLRGYELSQRLHPSSGLYTLKTVLVMLSLCWLLSSPWLTSAYDSFRAGSASALEVYDKASTLFWTLGLSLLWLAAIASAVTGYQIIFQTQKMPPENAS